MSFKGKKAKKEFNKNYKEKEDQKKASKQNKNSTGSNDSQNKKYDQRTKRDKQTYLKQRHINNDLPNADIYDEPIKEDVFVEIQQPRTIDLTEIELWIRQRNLGKHSAVTEISVTYMPESYRFKATREDYLANPSSNDVESFEAEGRTGMEALCNCFGYCPTEDVDTSSIDRFLKEYPKSYLSLAPNIARRSVDGYISALNVSRKYSYECVDCFVSPNTVNESIHFLNEKTTKFFNKKDADAEAIEVSKDTEVTL